ncbi:MAG: LacI family DNA-binding transcriptional regulator [Verrucomicrobiota bacterium]
MNATKITMQDLANVLELSSSTVSRALKNDLRISEKTRKRVIEKANQLQYRPNPMVSALMATRKKRGGSGEIGTIALITDYRGSQKWREKDVCIWAYNGILKRASELGYTISIFDLKDYHYDPKRLEQTLLARGIRGVLLGFSREANTQFQISSEKFVLAGLSTYFGHIQVDRANFYGFYNVRLALEELWKYGYRKPGLVVPEFNNAVSDHAWSAAFLDWQRLRYQKEEKRCCPFIPNGSSSGSDFKKWMSHEKPDVILVYKFPVRHYLNEMGLRVPEDIGLAYLYRNADEMGMAAGIDGRMNLVGAASVDLVVKKLQLNLSGEDTNTNDVLIKGRWHHGPTLTQLKQDKEEALLEK